MRTFSGSIFLQVSVLEACFKNLNKYTIEHIFFLVQETVSKIEIFNFLHKCFSIFRILYWAVLLKTAKCTHGNWYTALLGRFLYAGYTDSPIFRSILDFPCDSLTPFKFSLSLASTENIFLYIKIYKMPIFYILFVNIQCIKFKLKMSEN